MIKQGESIFIPFKTGEGVSDAHNKARTYKSVEACRKALKHNFDKVVIVEYAPVKHGRWCKCGAPGAITGEWRCSVCDYISIRFYDYCPNCGARMDGKEHEK